MNKHVNSLPWKILGTILKLEKGGTQTYEPKKEEIDDYGQCFTPKIAQTKERLYESRKEGGRGFTHIENCADASIQALEDNFEKEQRKITYCSQ